MSAEPGGGLRVELLGPPRAWLDSTEINLGSPRRRAVFAALALRAGRSVPRAELIATVWGDTRPASVEGNLHTYISDLRRALDPARATRCSESLLISDAVGYAVRVAPADLDVTVFERLCDEATRLAAVGDHHGVVECLDTALGLWRGDALSGVPGPFADTERERLGRMRLAAVEGRAVSVLALGGHRELSAELATLVKEHPITESWRELLMLALYRSGRHAEALEVFHDARRVLIEELGVEPGAALRRLHEQVLAFDPALDLPDAATVRQTDPIPLLPVQVGRAVRRNAEGRFVGREREVRRLRDLVTDVAAGRGRAVWVEGEPGIGKSELLAVALADAAGRGCQVRWRTCHEIDSRFPLRVFKDCLGVDGRTPTEPILVAVDTVLSLVDELCSRAPLVLVFDDLHCADDISLRVCERLAAAARRWPLLLVVACRPVANRAELARLRGRLTADGNTLLPVTALTADETAALVRLMAGDDAVLPDLIAGATGNPLHASEIARHAMSTGEFAELTLTEAVGDRLSRLDTRTRIVLNWASVLGPEFAVADLATVMGRQTGDLSAALAEAMAADVLADGGERMVFDHSVLREVCYGWKHGLARDALHLHAAKAMADTGAPVRRVAEQLAAVPTITAPWMTKWLAAHHDELSGESPLLAADLAERAVTHGPAGDPHREALLAALAGVLFHLERDPKALANEARDSDGAYVDHVPEIWCNRHSLLVAGFRNRDNQGDVRGALATAGGDEYRTAYTLQTLWLLCSVNRDHRQALSYLDQAIAAADGHGKLAVLQMELLDNRMFTLQNLDELDEAGQTLAKAREIAARHSLPADPLVAGAVHHYWTGRWDDALVGLDTMSRDDPSVSFYGLRDPDEALLLLHGVAALIAVRRDDEGTAAAHLDATEEHPPATGAEWDNVDFLLAAHSMLAERAGDVDRALRTLRPMLTPTDARMLLRHQWLPRFVRLAMTAGDSELAVEGMRVCAAEASKEIHPARAFAAAQWCRGLVERDSARVLNAAAHYRKVGRRMELGSVLEDAAVLLGEVGDTTRAVRALNETVEIYGDLGAHWDIRRAEQRLAAVGVSRTVHTSSAATDSGWDSLSPLEVQVATLAAAGYSDPHAVAQLALHRRNIQTHVASVLSKLDDPSRHEAAEEPKDSRRSGLGT